jgi:hypothetical protein
MSGIVRGCFTSERLVSLHAQQESAAASYVDVVSRRCERDLANRRGATSVDDRQAFKAIGSACIGGEDPQRLRAIVAVEVGAAGFV